MTRIIDCINIDNKMYSNSDWRAYVQCKDERGYMWSLRALWASTPEEAMTNAMEAFNEKDWTLYGWIIRDPQGNLINGD